MWRSSTQTPGELNIPPKFNKQEIEFLDILVSQEGGRFNSSTYFKPVDINSYLDFESHHYRNWKENMTFGNVRRIGKNCAQDSQFEKKANIIKGRRKEKGYPKNLITKAYRRAKSSSQAKYLGIEQDPLTP